MDALTTAIRDARRAFLGLKRDLVDLARTALPPDARAKLVQVGNKINALDTALFSVILRPEVRYSVTPVNNGQAWGILKIVGDRWVDTGIEYATAAEAILAIPGLVVGDAYPDWAQPVLPNTGYNIGDRVTHVSLNWESALNNNVHEPGVFGWIEI